VKPRSGYPLTCSNTEGIKGKPPAIRGLPLISKKFSQKVEKGHYVDCSQTGTDFSLVKPV
jgi:hypothetical protein